MKNIPFIILLFFSLNVLGQKIKKTPLDTVYYLADTTKTPIKDRMLDISTEIYAKMGKSDTIQSFRINCKCLPYGYYPIFTRHLSSQRQLIVSSEINRISFISLSDLLNLTLKDYDKDFYHKHVILIVEAINNRYLLGEVFLTHFSAPVQ